MKQETGRNGDYLSTDCAVGVYMEVLFKDIYGFKSTAEFTSGFNINGAVPGGKASVVIVDNESCTSAQHVHISTTTLSHTACG